MEEVRGKEAVMKKKEDTGCLRRQDKESKIDKCIEDLIKKHKEKYTKP